MRKRYKNAVGGVVHEAIQIAAESDLSTEERCIRVQHTCSSVTSPVPWSSKKRGGGWGIVQPAAAQWRGGDGGAW